MRDRDEFDEEPRPRKKDVFNSPFADVVLMMTIVFGIYGLFHLPEYLREEKGAVERVTAAIEKKVAPTVRFEQLALLPGEGKSITVPTKEYLVYLKNEVCCSKALTKLGRHECQQLFKEVEEGTRDINNRVNPIYGRPTFSEDQRLYLQRAEWRTSQLLRNLEQGFVLI